MQGNQANTSPQLDDEIDSDDSPTSSDQQKDSSILQMVLGGPSDDKEAVLRQKLLEKKAQLTEANLRKKLLERRGQLKEDSASSSPQKSKRKKQPPSTSSTKTLSSDSTPPKRKKKSHRHKKSKKQTKTPPVDHFQNLSEKGVLHRVIIRHLNPQEESTPDKRQKSSKKHDKRKSKRGKKSKSRHISSDDDHQNDLSKRKHRPSSWHKTECSPNNKISAKDTSKVVKRIQTAGIFEDQLATEIEVNKSPIPSPKIFLFQQYDQGDFESTSYANYREGSIEAKPFEDLTDEEKAMLSPTFLRFKESIYQKRLISQLPIFYPGISGCRSVDEFKILNRIEEGTFGVVYRALELNTDEIVALKRLKMENEKDGFPITSLREINMLMKCRNHPNVVSLKEIVVGPTMDKIFLVMEYVAHDVKVLLKLMEERKKKFTIAQIKTLMQQLLSGCAFLHGEWVLHRDLKTSNLLLSHNNILKIGDFGLAREFGDPLKSYTPVVVTLWYRSPELLLGCKIYSTAIDIWSIGCIFGEFMKLRPIFQGSSEMDQLNKIFMDTGTPNKTVWPSFEELPGLSRCVFANTPYNQLRKKFMTDLKSEAGLDLLNKLLALDPSRRISAETALRHPFFVEEPKPASLDSFPTWPSASEKKVLVPTQLDLPVVDKSGLLPLERSKQQLIEELEIDSKMLASNGFSLNQDVKR